MTLNELKEWNKTQTAPLRVFVHDNNGAVVGTALIDLGDIFSGDGYDFTVNETYPVSNYLIITRK